VPETDIRRLVERMSEGSRHSRRWLAEEEAEVQLATGTDGRGVPPALVKPKAKRRGLSLMFGQQLRLIK